MYIITASVKAFMYKCKFLNMSRYVPMHAALTMRLNFNGCSRARLRNSSPNSISRSRGSDGKGRRLTTGGGKVEGGGEARVRFIYLKM